MAGSGLVKGAEEKLSAEGAERQRTQRTQRAQRAPELDLGNQNAFLSKRQNAQAVATKKKTMLDQTGNQSEMVCVCT